jgi:pimeloyl-ACP methyl ester carboxylesterase
MPTPADLVCEDRLIPGPDAGIELFVRNKRPRTLATFEPCNTVLFVHGATYPAECAFDLRIGGTSWMDFIAAHGHDVYMLDVRGYGRSTRPPEMSGDPARHAPIVGTETAVRDFTAAAQYVMQRRNIASINVIGWSWGTVISALFAARNPDKVNRLVLHAPVWVRETGSLVDPGKPLGAYRRVTIEDALKRWATGLPEGRSTTRPEWQEAWLRETFASDPIGATADPRYLRAPNGVVQDIRDFWSQGKPMYRAADIRVPTLIVLGEWDADTPLYMAQTLFAQLANARPKRLVVIGESTHMLILEEPRLELFREVQLFLDDSRNGGASR